MLGFLSAFCPRGDGQNQIVWIIGGELRIHVQSMLQTRGSGGMLPWEILILDLLLDVICWNLACKCPPERNPDCAGNILNFCLFHMQAETIYAGFDENGTATGS